MSTPTRTRGEQANETNGGNVGNSSNTNSPSQQQNQSLSPSIVYPTKFTWHYEGKVVHLCGSFTNWLETVPMAPEIVPPNGNQVFSVVCNLPSGYHQYKFIVDGEWRHDENQAFIQDPLGNVNNWLFVKKPSATSGGGGSSVVSSPSNGGGIGSPGMSSAENVSMHSAQTGGGGGGGGGSGYNQQMMMTQQQQNYQQGTAPLEVPGMMSPGGGSSGMNEAGIIGGGQQAQVMHHQHQQDRPQAQWLSHDDSQSDSLNAAALEQQRRIQQQRQHQGGGSDQHLVGEISPERASQRHHHAMRDEANAAAAANVIDAGMDWVSGGINGLQIKRDGDGRRKSINVARDGGPIAAAAAAAAVASTRPPMQPSTNNNDYVEQQGGANPDDYASDASRARVLEFLQRHTAYELIPESNKVVVFDINLPVRQAFHAFYEQQIAAAPLWNPAKGDFAGMISAGEFIDLLRVLSEAFKDVKQVTEEDLDRFTVAKAREECGASVENSSLLSVRPEDSLHLVALVLLKNNMYSVPVVSYGGGGGQQSGGSQSKKSSGSSGGGGGDGGGGDTSDNKDSNNNNKMGSRNRNAAQLLHVTNLAEIFACLHRHFRGVPSSLPLFSQPLGALPIGTWTKEFGGRRSPSDSLLRRTNSFGQADAVEAASDEQFFANLPEELQRLAPLRCVYPQTTLAEAFTMMNGVSCLPVVDDSGRGGLIDVYARSDIVKLASNNAYLNVNMDEFTIARALQNSRMASGGGGYAPSSLLGGGGNDASMDGSSMNTMPSNVLNNKPPSPKFNASGMSDSPFHSGGGSPSKGNNNISTHAGGFSTCTRSDTLRAAVEALGLPGVKRLVVVDEKTGALEGIIALSDVMRFLLR